jgi:hypothetical protein
MHWTRFWKRRHEITKVITTQHFLYRCSCGFQAHWQRMEDHMNRRNWL